MRVLVDRIYDAVFEGQQLVFVVGLELTRRFGMRVKVLFATLMFVAGLSACAVSDDVSSLECTSESCPMHETAEAPSGVPSEQAAADPFALERYQALLVEQDHVQVPAELRLDAGGATTNTACIGYPGDCYSKGGNSDTERNKYCARECGVAFASCSVDYNAGISWGCVDMAWPYECLGSGYNSKHKCPYGSNGRCEIVYGTIGTCKVLSAPQ